MKPGKSLYSPWRIRYILNKSEAPPGCFMCHYGKHPPEDKENLVVARLEHYFLVLNRYPYAAGHLMLCPYEHLPSLSALTPAMLQELGEGLKQAELLLEKLMNPQGLNIGLNMGEAAGAGHADHLHFHIIPRWNGDTNFMPVIADIGVVPQALEELHQALVQSWKEIH